MPVVSNRAPTLHEAFRKQVELSGPRTAMVCSQRELSYWALDARSDAVARKLLDLGIGRGSVVGVFAPRGPETIAAMIGILKAGACYLPFDPTLSAKQLRYISDDATPALMLVQEEQLRQSRVPQFWTCPTLDIGPEAPLQTRRRQLTMPATTGEDLACVLYTCVSSGQPRGVQIPHRAFLRLTQPLGFVDLGADQVLLQVSPLACDAANFEIWGALLNGGKLAIVSAMHPSIDSVVDTIARHGVNTAWLNAGMFHQLVDHRLDTLKPLRQLLLAGDVLSAAHVERARQALPGCRLVCTYGPTETASLSCCYVVPMDAPVTEPLPIGTAVAQSEALVLDDSRRPIADDREGELYVGGFGLAHGYINRSQSTAERFTHATGSVQRLFRTGDRVRRRPDGNLELISRAERIVRSNGARIDLDGIESAVRRSGLVCDAAVTVIGDHEQRQIAAFVTPPPAGAVCTGELRRFLQSALPEYMVPSTVQVVDALPLAPNGRVDRAALAQRVPVAPRRATAKPVIESGLEARLLRIFREVLGDGSFNAQDNFFDAGGTSLQLEQAHAMIRAQIRRDIELMDLFTYPKISALAAWINRSAQSRERAAAATAAGDSWLRARLRYGTRGSPAPAGATWPG